MAWPCWHKWTKWELVDAPRIGKISGLLVEGVRTVQRRTCVKCGLVREDPLL